MYTLAALVPTRVRPHITNLFPRKQPIADDLARTSGVFAQDPAIRPFENGYRYILPKSLCRRWHGNL